MNKFHRTSLANLIIVQTRLFILAAVHRVVSCVTSQLQVSRTICIETVSKPRQNSNPAKSVCGDHRRIFNSLQKLPEYPNRDIRQFHNSFSEGAPSRSCREPKNNSKEEPQVAEWCAQAFISVRVLRDIKCRKELALRYTPDRR